MHPAIRGLYRQELPPPFLCSAWHAPVKAFREGPLNYVFRLLEAGRQYFCRDANVADCFVLCLLRSAVRFVLLLLVTKRDLLC